MRTRIWLPVLLWYCWCPRSTNSLYFPRFQQDKNTASKNNQQKETLDYHRQDCIKNSSSIMSVNKVLSTTGRCTCGKVKFAIQTLEPSPPPLRIVCYCSDCRGYYETLDRLAMEKGVPPSAILDVRAHSLAQSLDIPFCGSFDSSPVFLMDVFFFSFLMHFRVGVEWIGRHCIPAMLLFWKAKIY